MPPVKQLTEITKRIRESLNRKILIPVYSMDQQYIDLVSSRARRIYYRITVSNFPKDLFYLIQPRQEIIPRRYDYKW